jgi:hypothetical protein
MAAPSLAATVPRGAPDCAKCHNHRVNEFEEGAMAKIQSPGIWSRAAGDPEFREALIADPLRALASVGDTDVSAEQVRQLEEMTAQERATLVQEVLREIAMHRARRTWGDRFWTPDESLSAEDDPRAGDDDQ